MLSRYAGAVAFALSIIVCSPVGAEEQSAGQEGAAIKAEYHYFGEEYGQTVKEATVLNRARPDFDPVGGRYEGFRIFPYISLGIFYDDNLLSDSGGSDDVVLRSAAGIEARSDWGRHFLSARIDVEDFRHKNFHDEDVTNLAGVLRGRLDIRHDAALHGLISIIRAHEARNGVDDESSTTANSPIPYVQSRVAAFGERNNGRVRLKVSGSFDYYDYEDVSSVSGTNLDQDGRDGYILKSGVRKAYNFSPGYNVFGLVEGNLRNFKARGLNLDRDSRGVEVRAGVEFELTRLIAGEVSAGYLHQNYDNASFSNVDDLALKAALIWNPSRLMTVTLEVERLISETTVNAASGHLDTVLAARMDYEILRHVIGSVHIRYVDEEYKGVNRNDDVFVTGVELEYLFNRRVRAKAHYEYSTRNSAVPAVDYDKNVVGVSARIQF